MIGGRGGDGMGAMLQDFFEHCPGILLVASREGVILAANREAERTLRGARETPLSGCVHEEDRQSFGEQWAKAAAGSGTVRAVSRFQGPDGNFQALAWSARPAPGGEEVHVVLVPLPAT